MHAEAIRFLFAGTCKIFFFIGGILKTEFEFIHQQGCESNSKVKKGMIEKNDQ